MKQAILSSSDTHTIYVNRSERARDYWNALTQERPLTKLKVALGIVSILGIYVFGTLATIQLPRLGGVPEVLKTEDPISTDCLPL